MSYDRRRLRDSHPAACTCVDCEDHRSWQVPSPPIAPSKLVTKEVKPVTREDLNRLSKNQWPSQVKLGGRFLVGLAVSGAISLVIYLLLV